MTDAEDFALAVQQGLLALRIIAGKYQVCPVCFCTSVADELEILGGQFEHNVPLGPRSEAEVDRALFEIGDVAGNA